MFGHPWSGPEHLTLAQADRIDVLLPDLQDQASVHHIQQGVGVELLLLVLDFCRAGEQDLLEGDGPKEVHLLRGGLQVAKVQPAALGVTNGQRACCTTTVLEFQVKIRHWSRQRIGKRTRDVVKNLSKYA